MTTRVRAWLVADSGLVPAPGRFRRLAGRVRHHAGQGPAWPREVELEQGDGRLRVTALDGALVGDWSDGEVAARLLAAGPPVTFVLEVPDGAQLLAAATGPATDALLARLAAPPS
jgi:hypothetical protein